MADETKREYVLPNELIVKLEAAATKVGHSADQELAARLERTFEVDEFEDDASAEKFQSLLEKLVKQSEEAGKEQLRKELGLPPANDE